MQSAVSWQENVPASAQGLHVAIIMDGNGRWATRRGLARAAGHHAGIRALRRVVEAAPALGIGRLTLYAFSADNWRRPRAEVDTLMALLRHYLRSEMARLTENGVRLAVIGRRDRFPAGLADDIAAAEQACAAGTRLTLQIALDYSARTAIANAATGWLGDDSPSRGTFAALIARQGYGGADVDLLIRTGGEKRLSDFLLWELAYAELLFLDTLWPDFRPDDLHAALADFHGRERRFGGLIEPAAPLVAAE